MLVHTHIVPWLSQCEPMKSYDQNDEGVVVFMQIKWEKFHSCVSFSWWILFFLSSVLYEKLWPMVFKLNIINSSFKTIQWRQWESRKENKKKNRNKSNTGWIEFPNINLRWYTTSIRWWVRFERNIRIQQFYIAMCQKLVRILDATKNIDSIL